jgi:hypothetical protein
MSLRFFAKMQDFGLAYYRVRPRSANGWSNIMMDLIRTIPVKGWAIIVTAVGALILFGGGSLGGGFGTFFGALGLAVAASGFAIGALVKPKGGSNGGKARDREEIVMQHQTPVPE